MKRQKALLILLLVLFAGSGLAWADGTFFQVSPINALMEGVYDGAMTFRDLQKHGDLGIGTFEDLDGEMIAYGGAYYKIRSDGKAYPVPDSEKTPFAVVTFFRPDRTVLIDRPMDCRGLEGYADQLLPTRNIFYAFKLEGTFTTVKTRSVPRQEKPYRRLVEVVKEQSTFEFRNVSGTVVGFRFPDYLKGVNVPGYHFHFLTSDRTAGGHLLDCVIERAKLEVQYAHGLNMALPKGGLFYGIRLEEGKPSELNQVEKGK